MHLSELAERYDDRLRTSDFAEHDRSPNGLQVAPDDKEINKVAFAVDAVLETHREANAVGADVLVTHHGMIWDGLERVTDDVYERLEPLFEGGVALYVSHMPLDRHERLGNAAGMAEILELEDRAPFGSRGPEFFGMKGTLPSPMSRARLTSVLTEEYDPTDGSVRVKPHGPEEIESVALLPGWGANWLPEAIDEDHDAFVTGEPSYRVHHQSKEGNINVFLCGHYETETYGVRQLMGLADDWGLETVWIDVPTGI